MRSTLSSVASLTFVLVAVLLALGFVQVVRPSGARGDKAKAADRGWFARLTEKLVLPILCAVVLAAVGSASTAAWKILLDHGLSSRVVAVEFAVIAAGVLAVRLFGRRKHSGTSRWLRRFGVSGVIAATVFVLAAVVVAADREPCDVTSTAQEPPIPELTVSPDGLDYAGGKPGELGPFRTGPSVQPLPNHVPGVSRPFDEEPDFMPGCLNLGWSAG